MRRMRSGCCARAASGHAAAPPSSVMNSRRLMRPTAGRPTGWTIAPRKGLVGVTANVRLGSLADLAKPPRHCPLLPR